MKTLEGLDNTINQLTDIYTTLYQKKEQKIFTAHGTFIKTSPYPGY